MASPLENLSGPGKSLQKEPPDANEFAGLKRSGIGVRSPVLQIEEEEGTLPIFHSVSTSKLRGATGAVLTSK